VRKRYYLISWTGKRVPGYFDTWPDAERVREKTSGRPWQEWLIMREEIIGELDYQI